MTHAPQTSVMTPAARGFDWMDSRVDQQTPRAFAAGAGPGLVQSFDVRVVRKVTALAHLTQHIDKIAKLTGELGKHLTESLFEQRAVSMTGKRPVSAFAHGGVIIEIDNLSLQTVGKNAGDKQRYITQSAQRFAPRIGVRLIQRIGVHQRQRLYLPVHDKIRYSSENTIGDFPVIMLAVDVSAVGAGGGSIAWADTEGVLKVGPESAGATPGPACYDRGGIHPTVTDAYLVAGIIAPERFLGGEMQLEPGLAEKAIDQLGQLLGLARQQTADAILQVTTSNIYAELLPQLARRGVDVTDFSLIAYGAAGPTQVFMLARDLDLRRIIVPPSPGILCALGCLVADVRADFVQSIWRETSNLDDEELRDIFSELDTRAHDWLATQQVDLADVYVLRSADMCYVGQSYEVNVPFPDTDTNNLTADQVAGWFHHQYARVYGYTDEQSPTRMLEARLQIVGVTPKPDVHLMAGEKSTRPGEPQSRTVYENGHSFEATVWQRGQLEPDEVYPGPAIVEQYDTTVYVPEEFRVRVDKLANLIGERQ